MNSAGVESPSDVSSPAAPPGSDILIRAEGLTKTYQMGASRLEVLKGCDVAVRGGEFVAIMGKSGSGKSTLLHILGALDVPQAGQVYFANEPVFAPPGKRWLRTRATDIFSASERRRITLRRRHVGFVFQFYHLLPELNVLENVLLPRMVGASVFAWRGQRAAARRDARDIITRVGLSARLRHRPAELSGGERQRVAIARALVHHPRVLLADEPTGNLDAETGASILALLGSLHAAGQTIMLVTHDASVAERADRVLHLESGRLRGV
ncbi:MAG: ABC transporter ATP-binding protein [Phycisphaerae bacterium]